MPSNSVGGMFVKVRLDDKDALQQLERLRRKIQQTKDDLSRKRAQRDAISAEMEQAELATERARQKVEQLKEALAKAAPSERAGIRAQLTEANAELRQQMSTMDRLNRQWQKLDSDITAGESNLRRMTTDADTLEQQVRSSSGAFAHLHNSARQAAAGMSKAFARVGRMIKRVFVFTVILRALRALREALSNLLLSFPEIREALAEIKGNLLTAFTPLFNALLPYLQAFLNLLVKISAVLADIMAKVFSTTTSAAQASAEALRDQAAAYKAAGSAASKAGKQFASFDQINQLGNSSSDGAGSIKPIFNALNYEYENLEKIYDIVTLIGAGLLGWKIGSALHLDIGSTIGLMSSLYGSVELTRGLMDAWNDGVNLKNVVKSIKGLVATGGGMALLFGRIGAGIALVVEGLATFGVGLHDISENGMNLNNTLLTMAGLFASGLGISLLTGSAIPALIGGIAAVITWLIYAMGEGELFRDGLIDVFGGVSDFIKACVVGDEEAIQNALSRIWTGVQKIATSIGNAVSNLWDVIVEYIENNAAPWVVDLVHRLSNLGEKVFRGAKKMLSGIIDFITGVFTGDWTNAWEGLTSILKAVFNTAMELLAFNVNLIISALNALIDRLNNISITVPEWVPVIGGETAGLNIPHISRWDPPKLAQGAVIPPNREFLAVLGDQPSGTNIEAPLDTIVQAFRQALGERGGAGSRTVVLQVDKHELGRVTFDVYNTESQRVGVKLGGSLT